MTKLCNLSKLSKVLCMSAVLAVVAGSAFAATSFTGKLATSDVAVKDGLLTGTGQWIVNTSLTWTVSQNANGTWHYLYNFNAPIGDTTAMIFGVSPDFTTADVSNLTGNFLNYTVGTFTQSPDYPSLPGPIYGLMVSNNTSGLLSVSTQFDSDRAPVWQDFYAKVGKIGGVNVAAFNNGFLDPNPVDPPSNGSINNHILAPDSAPIPEPSALAMIPVGIMPLLSLRRKLRHA